MMLTRGNKGLPSRFNAASPPQVASEKKTKAFLSTLTRMTPPRSHHEHDAGQEPGDQPSQWLLVPLLLAYLSVRVFVSLEV